MFNKQTKTSDYDPKQKFDQEISVMKAGQKIIWKDYIRENNVDCEIYPTLEKYGCLKPIELNIELLHGDMSEFSDLRTNLDRKIKADKMWRGLPLDIRAQFNHDINEFIDRGSEWIKEKFSSHLQKKEFIQSANNKPTESMVNQEVTANGNE